MDDDVLRARLLALKNEPVGHYSAVIDHARLSRSNARVFRYGGHELGPKRKARLRQTLTLIDKGELKFEKVRDWSGPNEQRKVEKTVLVPVEKVERTRMFCYSSNLLAKLKANHAHTDLPLLSVQIGGRLHIRGR